MVVEGEEVDYDSDPEEAMLPLGMRRREASDDEEGEGDEREKHKRIDRVIGIGSDGESDCQGGAPAYEDEESEIEEEEDEDEEEGVEEEAQGEEEEEFEERDRDAGVEVKAPAVADTGGEMTGFCGKNQEEEEKKENEPFAVPTAGAFYMHDDRFRESGGGGHRRTPGGRKLWESKDDRAWVHDRFEEMNLQDGHYDEERRNPKGHFRGRGKNRGVDRVCRGNRARGYEDSNNHNRNPKGFRGRGPRRYEPPMRNSSENTSTQNKQSGKSVEMMSRSSSGRQAARTSNGQSEPVLPRKHVFASSLSSASPPFYPSGSSNQDVSVTQKIDAQTGVTSRNLSPNVLIEDNLSASHSGALLRGKAIIDPVVQDRHYVDGSLCSVPGKSSGSSSSVNTTQSPQSRVQGRGLTIPGQPNYQPNTSLNQLNRVASQAQVPAVSQKPAQNPVQPALRASSQPLGQRLGGGTQASSPPHGPSTNSSEVGDVESPPGSGKFKTSLVGKGKTSIQGSGRGSFLYNGAQVIGVTGAMGAAHGDQNFPGTPALLPVMQFGGHHPGVHGVPAVGMALPGYVAQPQLGFGNSEMTWVPVLAGATGALGATYCSPYMAVDGGYYARPAGQASSGSVSSRETIPSKPNKLWRSPQRHEVVDDEFEQRQNKPRRYSEMNFGQ